MTRKAVDDSLIEGLIKYGSLDGEDIKALLSDVRVASDEECEKCDWIVCIPWDGPHYFSDDVKDNCAVCNIAVRHRPSAPKQPARICMDCMREKLRAEH